MVDYVLVTKEAAGTEQDNRETIVIPDPCTMAWIEETTRSTANRLYSYVVGVGKDGTFIKLVYRNYDETSTGKLKLSVVNSKEHPIGTLYLLPQEEHTVLVQS